MSAIDQAFIRAYQSEDSPTATPPPAAPASAGSASPKPHIRVFTGETAVIQPPPQPASIRGSQPPAASAQQRRPLSDFAPAGRTVEARFKPAFEVDSFRWPAVCEHLVMRHAGALQEVVKTLLEADDAGRSIIGIAGAASGAGATTLVGALARLLLQAGKTVAIVDGNFAAPRLAESLGLAVAAGWEDVLTGRVPLAESVVMSLADEMALLPLATGGPAAAESLSSIHASVTAGVLRYHYDMVLVDAGSLSDTFQGSVVSQLARHCRLDGLLVIADPGDSAGAVECLAATAPELSALGLGVIENCRSAASIMTPMHG